MDTLSPEKRYCKVRKRKTKKCLDKLRKKSKTENKENAPFEVKRKPKIINKESGKQNKIINNNDLTNITKNRMIIKHGFFAKGARSATYSRVGLSEEYKARSEGNLNKIIDLANGEPKNVSLPIDKLHNIKEKLTSVKNECSDDKDLSFSEKSKDVHPNIKIIDVNSKSSIFKSPTQQINLRNTSVGHISPIKFSVKSKIKKSTSTSQLSVVVLKTRPKPSEKGIKMLGDYAKIYEEFTEHINCEFKKYIPSKIVDTTVNLKKYLKAVHSDCNSQSSNDNWALKDDHRHSNFSHNFSAQELTLMNVDKTPENCTLLNPIQYLRKVNESKTKSNCVTALRENVYPFRDSLQTQSIYECGASNSKYIDSLNHCSTNSGVNNNKLSNNMTCRSPEVPYLPTSKVTAQEVGSESHIINTFSNNSPDELMNCSCEIQNDVFAICVNTPEPRFYPRQMNHDK